MTSSINFENPGITYPIGLKYNKIIIDTITENEINADFIILYSNKII